MAGNAAAASLPASGMVFGTNFASNDPAYGSTILNSVGGGNIAAGFQNSTWTVPSFASYGAQLPTFAFFQPPNGALNGVAANDMTVAIAYQLPAAGIGSSLVNLVANEDPGGSFEGWQVAAGYPNNHKIGFYSGGSGGGWAGIGTTAVDDGAWHVSVITLTSTALAHYLDGVANGTASSVRPNSWAGINTIGVFNPTTCCTASNEGINTLQMAGLYVWNRALTTGEIATVSSVLAGYPTRTRAVVPTRELSPMTFVSVPDNGLVRTPLMYYSTWYYNNNVTEAQVKAQSDALVSTGLAAAGFNTMEIDYPNPTRDGSGVLHADATRFPDDFLIIHNYIHADGLKVGFYISPAYSGCAGDVGSYNHFRQDANQMAALGVDMLKFDLCGATGGPSSRNYSDVFPSATAQQISNYLYQQMALYLQATGRPIVYSVDSWGIAGNDLSWCTGTGGVGNTCMVRYDSTDLTTWADILASLDANAGLGLVTNVGHWRDPDALVIGQSALSDAQGIAQMSLWSILSAVLTVSTDLTAISSNSLATLKNLDALAINQDALGYTGDRISQVACGGANCEVWAKQLSGTHSCALTFLNRDTAAHTISITWSALATAIPGCGTGPFTTTSNIWANWPTCTSNHCAASLGTLTSGYTTASMPATSAVMIKIAP